MSYGEQRDGVRVDDLEYEDDIEFLRDVMRRFPRTADSLEPLLNALQGGGHASVGGSFALRAALEDIERRLDGRND